MKTSHDGDDLASNYWQTWCEWREQYALDDGCFDELRAAIFVELENASLPLEQHFRLRAIAVLIQEARSGDRAA